MAFGKKGWRSIVIDGQVYYWQAAEDSSWHAGLSVQSDILQARPEHEPHRLLIVRSAQCGQQACGFSGVVTPRFVRDCIQAAIVSGWSDKRPELQLILFNDPPRHVIRQPSWLTSTVLALAQGIYAAGAFDRMAILADALQDAGCDNEDVLNHCRQPGEHGRGCWVVNLILEKS